MEVVGKVFITIVTLLPVAYVISLWSGHPMPLGMPSFEFVDWPVTKKVIGTILGAILPIWLFAGSFDANHEEELWMKKTLQGLSGAGLICWIVLLGWIWN